MVAGGDSIDPHMAGEGNWKHDHRRFFGACPDGAEETPASSAQGKPPCTDPLPTIGISHYWRNEDSSGHGGQQRQWSRPGESCSEAIIFGANAGQVGIEADRDRLVRAG